MQRSNSLFFLKVSMSPILAGMGGSFGHGGSSGGTPSFHEIFAKAREQQQQQQGGGGGFPFGGGALNPYATGGPSSGITPSLRGDEFIDMGQLMQMREKLQQTFTPEMRRQVQDALQGGGGMPGGMGIMAFGIGENENGKRVAKGAKIMVDNNGNVTKEYKEHQIDPDDMLPKHDKSDATTYNYDDATEVQFEEGNGTDSTKAESISEMEVEFAPEEDSKKK